VPPVIEARGLSSAASAANAAIDTVASLVTATTSDDCVSVAVTSHGEYGVPEGLTFGFRLFRTGMVLGRSRRVSSRTNSPKVESRSRPTTALERDEVKTLGLI